MSRRDQGGFTLLELMVVVLIIAVLLAVAIPTFAGAQGRASDRAAQSNVRNALTSEIVHYSDGQVFSEDTTVMEDIDASLTWVTALGAVGSTNTVFVQVLSTFRADDTVVVATRSMSTDTCFWLRTVGDNNLPRYATNDCTAVPAVFGNRWS